MIDARILAVQGVGYAPYAMAVQGEVALSVNVPKYYRPGGGPDPLVDWRYGVQPEIRKTGDQAEDLKAHLLELTAVPLVGTTEAERQESKLARSFGLAVPNGIVEVPLFKPSIGTIPKSLIMADLAAYTARVQEEINIERRRIMLLLSA